MRMAGQASPSLTSRLVCELKTKGEEEREHAFDKRLAVAKQLIVGRFVVKIDSDGSVFAGLAGRVAHGSSSGQMVGAADDPQWGKTCLMARRPRQRWALPLNTGVTTKYDGMWNISMLRRVIEHQNKQEHSCPHRCIRS